MTHEIKRESLRESIELLQQEVSRRGFLKRAVQAAAMGVFWDRFGGQLFAQNSSTTNPYAVFGAIGNIVIPVDEDPGWKTFEPGISQYGLDVMVQQVLFAGNLPIFQGVLGTLQAFNDLPPLLGFSPVKFLQMPEQAQAQYLGGVLTFQFEMTGAQDILFLGAFVSLFATKATFFSNYPNHLATPGAEFQVRQPLSFKTGWDIIGFPGPVGPEEGERLRRNRGHVQFLRGMDPNNQYV